MAKKNNIKKEEISETQPEAPKEEIEEVEEVDEANEEDSMETEKVEEKPIAETTKAAETWQEVLKSQQPDQVLKELGFDDKTVKIFQKLKGFDKIDFFSNLECRFRV
mgnify:CR=1 FL=1